MEILIEQVLVVFKWLFTGKDMLLLSILSISHKSHLLLLSKADPSLGKQCCGFRTRQHHLLSVRPGHIYLEAMQTIKRCFICLATQLGHIHLEVIQYENIFSEKMHYSSVKTILLHICKYRHLNASLARHLWALSALLK